jgi:hypothetical protein
MRRKKMEDHLGSTWQRAGKQAGVQNEASLAIFFLQKKLVLKDV